MQRRIRHALRQPALGWLFVLAGGLAMSWPLLDVAAGNCAVGPITAEIALECQWQTLVYLFVVWSALIVALFAIALAGAGEQPARAKSGEHA